MKKHWLGELLFALVVVLVSKATDWLVEAQMLKLLLQKFIVELWPLWLGLIAWGFFWITRDYIFLRRLKRWIEPQHPAFLDWLRPQPPYSYPTIAMKSLDERIIAMLEWWKEREAKSTKPQ